MRTHLPASDHLKLGDLAEELVAEFDLGGLHGFEALETEGFDILADEHAAIDDGFFQQTEGDFAHETARHGDGSGRIPVIRDPRPHHTPWAA